MADFFAFTVLALFAIYGFVELYFFLKEKLLSEIVENKYVVLNLEKYDQEEETLLKTFYRNGMGVSPKKEMILIRNRGMSQGQVNDLLSDIAGYRDIVFLSDDYVIEK